MSRELLVQEKSESEEIEESVAFKKHLGMFVHPRGSHLIDRTKPLGEWIRQRTELSTWPYARTLEQSPATTTRLKSQNGIVVEGMNFGSQDYLGLASHGFAHRWADRISGRSLYEIARKSATQSLEAETATGDKKEKRAALSCRLSPPSFNGLRFTAHGFKMNTCHSRAFASC